LPPKAKDFWDFVDKSDESGCWPWLGSKNHGGYGKTKRKGRMIRAHRLAYEMTKGPIPNDMVVMHSCDNRSCCNPDHLIIGTHADNRRDSVKKNGGITLETANLIRFQYALGNVSYSTLGFMYGVSTSVIGRIIRDERWRN